MANYRAILRCFPAAQDYLNERKWIRRGDVVAYKPMVQTSSFSTDEFGFRHTHFDARDISLANIEDYERVGLVLGSSHLFGFALAGNDKPLPSQLSQIYGYPFFGIAYPEADSRTLHATLLRLLRRYPKRTRQVLLIPGGDFTRYCYAETADPLFGPPMLPADARLKPAEEAKMQFVNLVHFTSLWTEACAELASLAGARFYLADDLTFFEKSTADATEQACELGLAQDEAQRNRFSVHRRHAEAFQRERRRLAEAKGLRLVSYPAPDELLFIDEYHYSAESQALIAKHLAQQIG